LLLEANIGALVVPYSEQAWSSLWNIPCVHKRGPRARKGKGFVMCKRFWTQFRFRIVVDRTHGNFSDLAPSKSYALHTARLEQITHQSSRC
jgi:hypothetical protein